MNPRRKEWRNQIEFSRKHRKWQTSTCAEMDDNSIENPNLNNNINCPRTFYNGQETRDSDWEDQCENLTTFQTLSDQKTRGIKYRKKTNQSRDRSFHYTNKSQRLEKPTIRKYKTGSHSNFNAKLHVIKQSNKDDASSKDIFDSSKRLNKSNVNKHKYDIEFLPNSVNTYCQKTEVGDVNLNLTQPCDLSNEFEKLSILNTAKETYMNTLKSVKPSEVIMDSRKYIEEKSNKCTENHFEKICKVKSYIESNVYASTFKSHFINLRKQQDVFDTCINNFKKELSHIYDNEIESVLNKSDKIRQYVQNECQLFSKTFPAYAWKFDVLEALKKNQVVLISADNSYFFNAVIPCVIQSILPDYNIISCEKNFVSLARLKTLVSNTIDSKTISKINFMTEEEIIKYFCNDFTPKDTFAAVLNIPLKRSIICDLILSVLQNFLCKNETSRLILLVSIYDDSEKYEKYFSSLKVGMLSVPKLVFPVTVVWKQEPLPNFSTYIHEVIKTALSIHTLNEPGDILAFLPNIADAKTATAMFIKKLEELNCDDVRCTLIEESSSEKCFYPGSESQVRTVYFTTSAAESIPIRSVCYIIDSGLKREYMFDKGKKVDFMNTVFNSRASSRLRKYMAGIISPGICYRIYSKENFCYDMTSFENPDLLSLNPFNSFITLFHYQPEQALCMDFVEQLDESVKNNTITLLKKFNAVKNGKLTPIGEKMGKLLLPARYSKLILQGIQWDFAYEAVILVAYFSRNCNVFKFYKDHESQQAVEAAKLDLLHNDSDPISFDSDPISFLHIFKLWIDNKCSDTWCEKFYIDINALFEIKKKVDEICQQVYQCLNETIFQVFSECENSLTEILEMLFHCFSDNLCVFAGHKRSGYKILSSRHTAFIHPSSLLSSKDSYPKFIIFNKMKCTTRNFLFDITAIPDDMVCSNFSELEKALEFDYSEAFERCLVSKVIEPVSEKIIKQILLGKKAKKLEEIERYIKKELKTDWIVVDPLVDKGCVYVYALESFLNSAVSIVENILKNNLDDLINAEQINLLNLRKGETVVSVEVKCVMGGKIVAAKVINNPNDSQCNPKSMHTPKKGYAIDNSFLQCSINLTWVRRTCIGICYVDFNPSEFMQARKLTTQNLRILDSEVCVEVNNKMNNQLIISDVPLEARPSDIEIALRQLLPRVKNINVKMIFSPLFETTERDIENFKIEIQENCEEFTELTDYDIIIHKPKNAATIMTAYINVFGTEDLSHAAESLSNTIINKFKVTAIPVYRSIRKCNLKIYQALEDRLNDELDKLKKFLRKQYPSEDMFQFQPDIMSQDTVSFKLLSNNIQIMKHLQITINELLDGEILDKDIIEDIHKLFCHGGHLLLRTLEKSQKVYILEDFNSKVIRLYGLPQNCFKVKECIINFLKDSKNEAIETITLLSDKNSRILLKSIIKEYGVKLEKFVEECELRSAVLEIKSCNLILHGSRESIEKAKEVLSVLSNKMDPSEEISLFSSGEMCPVCACPAFNLSFRLQHCGHLYCSECILSLVEQAQFPLQCCAEDCFSDIVLDDIERILDDPEKINNLLHSSLNNFLQQSTTEIFYCPTPDCSMFFYKNEIDDKLNCPLCHNDICSKCSVIYHHGYSCDMYQGSKEDSDYSFKVWKKSTTECKNCPRCNTAIEKIQGCDHMTCLSCKAHFCWVCVREFATGREVYNHIPFCDKHPKW